MGASNLTKVRYVSYLEDFEEFSTVFRIQGGVLPKASRHHIAIDEFGDVSISRTTLNVSIGKGWPWT